VAHELRTPLTNMRGYLEALCDEILPPSNQTFSLLQDETLRLATLVEDVLNLARADSATGDLRPVETNLRKIITDAIATFSRRFDEKSVSISDSGLRAIQDEAATVWADADKITRVIRNLTDNAATYTPEGGEIEIGIETGPEAVSVYYTNNAGDVSPDDLPYLFERFYRGEKSRSREHGGAGIGLAIVNELIKSHGGSVDAGLLDGKIRIGFSLPKGLPPA